MTLLSEAERSLCDGVGPLRDRLSEAAPWFVAALPYRTRWDQTMRERAERIADHLLHSGSAEEAVRRMDEQTISLIAGLIVEFAEDAAGRGREQTDGEVRGNGDGVVREDGLDWQRPDFVGLDELRAFRAELQSPETSGSEE